MHKELIKRLYEKGNVAKIVALAGIKAKAERGWKRQKKVRLTRQAVHCWAENGVPAERCALVEEATGIPLHELRPDIFPAPPHKSNGKC
jgi:hypothetical protein